MFSSKVIRTLLIIIIDFFAFSGFRTVTMHALELFNDVCGPGGFILVLTVR